MTANNNPASCLVPKRKRRPPTMPTEWASDIQLAQRYSVSRATIWRWGADPNHPLPSPIKIGKNCSRWRLSDVVAAMEGGHDAD